MKKTLVLTLAILSVLGFTGIAQAQTTAVPTIAPYTKTMDAKPPSPEQTLMQSCENKFFEQKIPEDQYHPFINSCLKNGTSTTGATTPMPTPPTTK